MNDPSAGTDPTTDRAWLHEVKLVRFPSEAKGELTVWRVLDLLAGEGEIDRITYGPPPPRGVDQQLYAFVNTLGCCEWSDPQAMHDTLLPLLPRLMATDGGDALREVRVDYFLKAAAVEYVPRVVGSILDALAKSGKDCAAARSALEAFVAEPTNNRLRELGEHGTALRITCDLDVHSAQAAVQARFFDDHGDPRDREHPENSIDGLREALKTDGDYIAATQLSRRANLVWYAPQQLLDGRAIAVEAGGEFPGLSAYCAATLASFGGDELMKLAAQHAVAAIELTAPAVESP